MSHPSIPLAVRLKRNTCPEPNTGCWLWTEGTSTSGYGKLMAGGSDTRTLLAHRVSYELHRGPIPDGMCVLHRCDTPACVNPDHLFIGTRADNNRDASSKGRCLAQAKPWRMARGERNAASKLTGPLVLQMRAAFDGGEAIKSVARRFGVSPTTAKKVVKRIHWRHINETRA